MSNIENEEQLLSLELGNSTIQFRDPKNAMRWLEQEKEFWGWLRGNNGNGAAELFRYSFLEPLNRAESLIHDSQRNIVELGSKNTPYVHRDSPTAKLVENIKEQHGGLVAYFSLLYLLPQRNYLIQTHSYIKSSVGDLNNIYAKDLASHIVFTRENLSDLIINSEEESIKSKAAFFESTVKDANQSLQDEIYKTKDLLSSVEIEYEARAALQKRQFEKRINFYRNQAKALKRNTEETVELAKNDVAAAKAAFHDTVDFKASVEYWAVREINHRTAKNRWLIAALMSMTLTFLGLISYYSAGGATGLAKRLHAAPETETSVTTAQLSETSPIKIGISEKPSDSNITSIQQKFAPTNSTIIADISGAFLLLTLMGLLIRICLNQFNSSAHYMNDAAERIVFTKTYLALLRENKLSADADRKLALDSLFRSSNAGAANEIPFSNPIEMVVRAAEKKVS
jgi:hypothetical protein